MPKILSQILLVFRLSLTQFLLQMDKVVTASLRNSIAKQVSELTTLNNEFYTSLKKIGAIASENSSMLENKLQSMRADVREKIKNLAFNIDLLYQTLDAKIGIVVDQMRKLNGNDSGLLLRLEQTEKTNKQLQQEIERIQAKNQFLSSQNEELKTKNIQLLNQIQQNDRRREKREQPTYDSSQGGYAHQTEFSMDSKSPIKTKAKPNDYTFNAPKDSASAIFNAFSDNQKQQEQPSFSEMLIREQRSYEENYPSEKNIKESGKFSFGCMPKKAVLLNKQKRNEQSGTFSKNPTDQGHRINYLLKNLQSSQSRISSNSKSKFEYRSRNQSEEKSILSNRVVQKYHI